MEGFNAMDAESGHLKLRQPSTFQKPVYEVMDLQIPVADFHDMCGSEGLDDDLPLLHYHEIPAFLQGNPWVQTGYRSMLPFNKCCRSVLSWNNETVNIWSHLFGCFLFFVLMLYDNLVMIPAYGGSVSDHIIITLALMCFQFCMLCSAGYHTFVCHSERASKRWLSIDLTGISIGLIGCYIPGVHYAFYCLSLWRDVYLVTVALLFGAVLTFQTSPRYLTAAWFYRRLFLYLGLAGYGVIPGIHWVYLNGGFGSPLVNIFLPKLVIMYFLGVIAFVFYLTKCPERLFPGKFDYVGCSHQWWHIIVVVAFLWWHEAGKDLLIFYTKTKMCYL